MDEVEVVLAGDVQLGVALAGRGAFVVEDTDRGPVVHEAVEQDRAGVRDDAVDVLEQRRERLEIGVRRLLDRDPR